jgi:tripartite-type tricarboxylate transporter receptor subunit TctC
MLAMSMHSGAAMAAGAGNYPERPIRLIVPFPPGGGTDILGRFIAQRLGEALKQTVVVENIPGATGTVGTAALLRSPADGHHLLLGITATHAIAPAMYPHLRYDPIKDFVPIGQVSVLGNAIVVNNDVPVKNIQELVVWSRKTDGSYGSWGAGSGGHLSMESVKSLTGMKLAHIPYKGALAALNDTIAGTLPVTTVDVTSVVPFKQSGKVRVIAVTGSSRSPNMPDVPTLQEQGVAFDTDSWYALFAAAGTPSPIVERLRGALSQVMASPDMPQLLTRLGMNRASTTPARFEAVMKKDLAVWSDLVRKSGAASSGS